MRFFSKEIKVEAVGVKEPALLWGYIPDNSGEIDKNRKHPAVLILPGGGYEFTSEREGEAVALRFAAEGICAFVLKYHVAPARFPAALCEALTAMAFIRENSEEYQVDSENISVCGFSAGGHLAASVGVHWNKESVLKYIGKKAATVRPDNLVLCYPVITSGEYTHEGSMKSLLGDKRMDEELVLFNDLDKQVAADTPRTFIWHTWDDTVVPVENTLFFATALAKSKVETEAHIYPSGFHGLSLGNSVVNGGWKYGEEHPSSEWLEKAVRFIYSK
ncbi:alpha/beta hydrolase [Anaerocolumna chitinilytica]|uniref:Acetylesterase n=1 Tax=Anaerocolumna chitinilytica TaxID=1727145 RepID=A0A7I8DFN9_9FIRM|nr:alpha/beta hydrolase [Anaerocolumna chitinilytica]BCJ97200.1 acetylesterase [Anaerocolumna chitinilytica]